VNYEDIIVPLLTGLFQSSGSSSADTQASRYTSPAARPNAWRRLLKSLISIRTRPSSVRSS
jgi:hypothetical protein